MACNVCRKFTRLSDPKSALVLGTNKFSKDPLYKHEKSTCHIACVNHQCYLDSKGKLGSATSTAIGRGILAQGTKRITRQYSLLRTSAPQEVLVRTGQHWSVYTGRPVKFSNSQDTNNLHTIRKRMPIPFQ